MSTNLYDQLEQYCSFGPYPFHMPGHKRRLAPNVQLPYGWDVTEVPGTDDLHEAMGILAQAMERTGKFWGSQKTWYLVNGSTCGLLAGIRALAPQNARIIAARNCHKAVFHAIELGNLSVRWIMPKVLPEGVCGPVDPEDLKKALEDCPDAACVVLTSPTYEGILSDIQACAALCHEKQIPLLVDEAHGAHLGLFPGWPESALHAGADVVIQSVHKTLPSLTQTALLHLGQDSLADPDEIERQLAIFETSSPSYPLMVSIDSCTDLLIRQGQWLFARWRQRLETFDREIQGLQHLQVLGHSRKREDFDPGKLPICTAGTNLRGRDLARILRDRYGMETEMSQGDICLAMTGLGDSDRAMHSLAEALLEIDSLVSTAERQAVLTIPHPGAEACPVAQAVRKPCEEVYLENAQDRISAEYVMAYPPGIPLILPGEVVSAEFVGVARELISSGTELHHSRGGKKGIAVLKP